MRVCWGKSSMGHQRKCPDTYREKVVLHMVNEKMVQPVRPHGDRALLRSNTPYLVLLLNPLNMYKLRHEYDGGFGYALLLWESNAFACAG